MIPVAHIREWRNHVPWLETDMIEQDLVICRAIVEIFNDSYLAENMAFRGGTAIHKLFMNPQPRYSEDIDLVQIKSMPIKETITPTCNHFQDLLTKEVGRSFLVSAKYYTS